MRTKRYGFTNVRWCVAPALQLMLHSDGERFSSHMHPDRVTNYVICVEFDGAGKVVGVVMES